MLSHPKDLLRIEGLGGQFGVAALAGHADDGGQVGQAHVPDSNTVKMNTVPELASYSRASSEPRVVLPDPVSPTTASVLPAGMSRSMPVTAGRSAPGVGKADMVQTDVAGDLGEVDADRAGLGLVDLDGQVEVFEIRANRAEGQVAKTVRTYSEAVAWFAGAHLIPRSSHARCDAGEPHGMRTNQQVPHPEDLAQVWPDLSGDNRRPAPWRHCQARTVAGQITASFLALGTLILAWQIASSEPVAVK